MPHFFRRRRGDAAGPVRRALHGASVAVSSAGFAFGTTFVGADAPTACGLGLAAGSVLLSCFPLPARRKPDTPPNRPAGPPVLEGNMAEIGPAEGTSAEANTVETVPAIDVPVEDKALGGAPQTGTTHNAVPQDAAWGDGEAKPAEQGRLRDEPKATEAPSAASPVPVEAVNTPPPSRRAADPFLFVFEPRFEIKPCITVFETRFETAGPDTPPPAGPDRTPPADPDSAPSGDVGNES